MQAAGWFGKLAFLGDFASRRLSAEWVQSCDQWLSGCMESAARQLGSGFLPAYLHAPVWRFACGPGVMDEQWWFGVLMASCDKVGRYFPIVVAQPRQHDIDRQARRVDAEIGLLVFGLARLQQAPQLFHRLDGMRHRPEIALPHDPVHVLLGTGLQPDRVALRQQQFIGLGFVDDAAADGDDAA